MPRSTVSRHRRRVFALMLVYIGLMYFLWPHVRTTTSVPLKALLVMLPIVPMGAALWLIAMDVIHSDELQQRVHLIALAVASGFTSTATFAAGILCAAGVLALGGDDLMFVLPVMALVYAGTNWLVGRRYGRAGCG